MRVLELLLLVAAGTWATPVPKPQGRGGDARAITSDRDGSSSSWSPPSWFSPTLGNARAFFRGKDKIAKAKKNDWTPKDKAACRAHMVPAHPLRSAPHPPSSPIKCCSPETDSPDFSPLQTALYAKEFEREDYKRFLAQVLDLEGEDGLKERDALNAKHIEEICRTRESAEQWAKRLAPAAEKQEEEKEDGATRQQDQEQTRSQPGDTFRHTPLAARRRGADMPGRGQAKTSRPGHVDAGAVGDLAARVAFGGGVLAAGWAGVEGLLQGAARLVPALARGW